MIAALILLHIALGLVVLGLNNRVGRRGFAVVAIAPLATLIWLSAHVSEVIDGTVTNFRLEWVAELGLALDFRLDALSLVMLILVSGIGLLVCWYALAYFDDAKPALGRLAGLMTIFAGSMIGLVLSDHLLTLFIFWELTSVTSYLLIGNDDRNARARDAALSAILITGTGGLVMLAGIVLLGQQAGTYRLSELALDPPVDAVSGIALFLILIGALTKSAQFPFSSWLPGAMVAPTPISTYLHAATMVKAGVYLVARLAPLFAIVGFWRPLLFTLGAITMILGGWRALRQNDLKVLLAHGTVSQLGFMMLLFGSGSYPLAQAGVVLLLAHGAFKASLFMVVGMVDHQAGTRDIRQLSGLGSSWRLVKWAAIIAAGSMAGLLPMLGFIAKEKALDGALQATFGGHQVLVVVIVVGSILTFAYSSRFVLGLYGRYASIENSADAALSFTYVDDNGMVTAPHRILAVPSLLLAFIALLTGVLPMILSDLVGAATQAMYLSSEPRAVQLWVGWNTAFTLSLIVIAAGVVLVVFRSHVYRGQKLLQEKMKAVPTSDEVFWFLVAFIIRFAKRTTRIVQNGSLPIYLMVILSVMALTSLIPLWGEIGELPALIGPGVHLAPLGFIIVAAIAATRVSHRLVAVLLLGAVGFGMAGFYVIEGAPDLALTQFSIETLATVLFVLVLRVLPKTFDDRRDAIMAPLRVAVAVLVGASIFVFALVASQSRQDVVAPSISQEMIARSLPDAQGANVVNVILVDFRGIDTLGEITVLLVAALGVVALARGTRRNVVSRTSMEPSPVIDASTRLLFTSIVVLSVYFLFAGHNQPGGGFVGGLVVGAALSFRYIAGGLPAVQNTVRIPARLVLGGGLLTAVGTALTPLFFGGSILEHASIKLDLPLFGAVKTTSALPFDIGVYLVVVGLILMAYEAFGDEPAGTADSVVTASPSGVAR